MRILALESSCDETAAAIVDHGWDVRASIVASQHDLHAEYAGVVPEIASRAHAQRITPVIRAALQQARTTLQDIDAIAIASQPGLIGALLVGVAAAKALAWANNKPIIAVDHVHAHLYAAFLNKPQPITTHLPALGLVVSGGHTSLATINPASPPTIKAIGRTIDDAAGEAFDKAANMLKLGHPGGPKLEQLAALGDPNAVKLPISRLDKHSLDFSFSGLKTALLYAIRGTPGPDATFPRDLQDITEQRRRDLAASFQRAVVAALILKAQRAIQQLEHANQPPRALIVGGGVTANTHLRQQLTALAESHNIPLHLPEQRFCVDNAAMIAALAHTKLAAGITDDLKLRATPTTGA